MDGLLKSQPSIYLLLRFNCNRVFFIPRPDGQHKSCCYSINSRKRFSGRVNPVAANWPQRLSSSLGEKICPSRSSMAAAHVTSVRQSAHFVQGMYLPYGDALRFMHTRVEELTAV